MKTLSTQLQKKKGEFENVLSITKSERQLLTSRKTTKATSDL